jgi:hypothetical protein
MKTRTYAEILASQGEYTQAADIYRHLLLKSPADGAMRARVAELETLAATADAALLAAFEASSQPTGRTAAAPSASAPHPVRPDAPSGWEAPAPSASAPPSEALLAALGPGGTRSPDAARPFPSRPQPQRAPSPERGRGAVSARAPSRPRSPRRQALEALLARILERKRPA